MIGKTVFRLRGGGAGGEGVQFVGAWAAPRGDPRRVRLGSSEWKSPVAINLQGCGAPWRGGAAITGVPRVSAKKTSFLGLLPDYHQTGGEVSGGGGVFHCESKGQKETLIQTTTTENQTPPTHPRGRELKRRGRVKQKEQKRQSPGPGQKCSAGGQPRRDRQDKGGGTIPYAERGRASAKTEERTRRCAPKKSPDG